VSRATLLTGQYESRHNINDFTTSLSNEALAKTSPMLLKMPVQAGLHRQIRGRQTSTDSLYDYWVDMEQEKKRNPIILQLVKNGLKIMTPIQLVMLYKNF